MTKKWDYCTVRVKNYFVENVQGPSDVQAQYSNRAGGNGPEIAKKLCELGQGGWEAICALPTFKEQDYQILMKRPAVKIGKPKKPSFEAIVYDLEAKRKRGSP